jgi:serine/threonine-protein kinase
MSQHDLYAGASTTRTMIGLGLPMEAQAARAARAAEASAEWVVKPFNWAVGLGAPVVREFTREALGVAKLRHPHIVQVVDAGGAPDGTPFVVLERLSGATLEERAGGTLIPLAELLPILRGVASGLTAAHAAGVAHRELRADNVFMADTAGYAHGFPKVLDFGVAELTAGACALGHEVAALASEAVPPEQRPDLTRGDAQSDQFALAALAYRFLAVAEITTAVELVLSRAMSWHPARRFDSIAAFVEALDAATRVRPEAPRAKDGAGERPAPPAVDAGSLTQHFFAEGDRLERATQEAASASGSRASATASADAAEDALSLPDRVPRSRASVIAALSLALVSLVVVGWTAVSLSDVPRWADQSAAEALKSPTAVSAPVSAGPSAAPARTASAALRALQRPKVPARPGRAPTEPPPAVAPAVKVPGASTSAVAAPAVPLPAPAVPRPSAPAAAPTPSVPVAEPGAVAEVPAVPGADPGAVAAAPPLTIDRGVTEPAEPTHGAPTEETHPAEQF